MVAALPQTQRVGVINVAVAGCRLELFDETTRETYAATVPPWMTAIIAELPRVIPNAYVISSKGCEARGDHLTTGPRSSSSASHGAGRPWGCRSAEAAA
jgi:hypothetical protein